MEDHKILKLCQVLANRYRNGSQYEDLLSEGLVACYECKDQGKTAEKDYVGAARRAMNDYINIKTKAVSIPSTWASQAVSRAMGQGEELEELEGVEDATLTLMQQAMGNYTLQLEYDTLEVEDHAEAFEKREYEAYVRRVAEETLSSEEFEILSMRYYKDMSQEDVAKTIGKGQTHVFRLEKSALEKLKTALL